MMLLREFTFTSSRLYTFPHYPSLQPNILYCFQQIYSFSLPRHFFNTIKYTASCPFSPSMSAPPHRQHRRQDAISLPEGQSVFKTYLPTINEHPQGNLIDRIKAVEQQIEEKRGREEEELKQEKSGSRAVSYIFSYIDVLCLLQRKSIQPLQSVICYTLYLLIIRTITIFIW